MDKCFCHLNGYAVKDAEARKRIEALEQGGTGEGGSAKGFYETEMPLGLIPSGNDVQVTTEITDITCKEAIKTLIEKIKADEVLKPIVTIANTSLTATIEGVEIENPSPRELRLSNMSVSEDGGNHTYTFYGEYDINLPSLSEEIQEGIHGYTGESVNSHAVLSVVGTWNEDVFTISNTSISLLKTTLVNKEYVDANAGSEIPEITYSGLSTLLMNTTDNNVVYPGTEVADQLNEVLTEYKDKLLNEFYLVTDYVYGSSVISQHKLKFTLHSKYVYSKTMSELNDSDVTYIAHYNYNGKQSTPLTYEYSFAVKYDEEGIHSFSSTPSIKVKNYSYITRDNTDPYTPTNNYQLATKKYVDDAVAGVSGGGESVDLTGYATEEYVNEAIANVGGSDVPTINFPQFDKIFTATSFDRTLIEDEITALLTEYKDKVLDCFDFVNSTTGGISTTFPNKIRMSLHTNTSNTITSMSGLSVAYYYGTYYNAASNCYDQITFAISTMSYDSNGIFNGSFGGFNRTAGYIPTMSTGISFTPSLNTHIANKKYVDDKVKSYTKTAFFRAKLTAESGSIAKDTESTIVFDTAELNFNSGFTLTDGTAKTNNTWCTYVKITAYLNFKPSAVGQSVTVRLYKGSTVLNQYAVSCEDQNGNMSLTIPDYVVATTAGDVFKITVASSNDAFTVRPNSYIAIEGLSSK